MVTVRFLVFMIFIWHHYAECSFYVMTILSVCSSVRLSTTLNQTVSKWLNLIIHRFQFTQFSSPVVLFLTLSSILKF